MAGATPLWALLPALLSLVARVRGACGIGGAKLSTVAALEPLRDRAVMGWAWVAAGAAGSTMAGPGKTTTELLMLSIDMGVPPCVWHGREPTRRNAPSIGMRHFRLLEKYP
jgi:hypothetical protein